MTQTPPNPLPNRRSIRLKGYDYSLAGAYFITICTHNRQYLFGEIENGEMKLNEMGQIAHDQWLQIPDRFPNIELGPFSFLPNHLHAILNILEPTVGAGLAPARASGQPQGLSLQTQIPALGDVIGAYKSLVVHECLKIYKSQNKFLGKLWQRSYYEHIIRDQKSFETIAAYIRANPAQWEQDQLYQEYRP